MRRSRMVTGLAGLMAAALALGVACTPPAEQGAATVVPAAATAAPTGTTGATGAGSGSTPTAAAKPAGQADPDARVTFMIAALAGTLDPFQGQGNPNVAGVRAVFDTLVALENGELVGNLAQSWRNVDPTTWEITLKPGVTFANGVPNDAQNVARVINYVRNPDNRAPIASAVRSVSDAEATGSLTVRITTRTPASDTAIRLISLMIPPMDTLEEMGRDRFGTSPVGSSLWTVTRFLPNQEVLLTARDGSWRGKPQFRELRIVSSASETVRVGALTTGEADMIDEPGPLGYQNLLSAGYRNYLEPQGVTYGIYMDSVQEGSPVASQPVRQALNYATNKIPLIEAFTANTAFNVGQYGYPGLPGWNPAIEPYPFDPVRARQLMAQGGMPNGFTTKMHMSADAGGGLVGVEAAQFVQAEWRREIGVNVELDIVDTATISSLFFGGQYHPLRLTALGYNDIATEFGFHLCNGAFPRRHCDPELDAVQAQISNEFDPARRTLLMQQANLILHNNPVQVYLGNPQNVTMMNQQIDGVRKRPGGYVMWEEVTKTR